MSDDDKLEIRTSQELGRYMVARRALRAGEAVLAEAPLVLGPAADSPLLCFDCHAPVALRFSCCAACRLAPVCPAHACRPAAPKWHDAAECAVFASLRALGATPLALATRPAALLPLRCLLRRATDPSAWALLMRMEHHLERRRGTDIWAFHRDTVEFLESLGLADEADEPDLVQRLCAVLDVNSFEVRGAGAGGGALRALYPRAQLLAHDCVGNTHVAVAPDYTMTVRAAADLAAGDLVLYNYVSALQSTAERQKRLRVGKYFECACRRCRDPAELGAHVGSLACARCAAGRVVPPPPAPAPTAAGEQRWRCGDCGEEFDADEMERTVDTCATDLERIDKGDAEQLEQYIARAARLLAPSHCLLLEAKQRLAGALRDAAAAAPAPPPAAALRRQLRLLAELLGVLDKLCPPISRDKAVALYELQATSAQLTRRLLEAREITAAAYTEQMAECERWLRQAVEMLVLEPRGSPEGALCARALCELRDLRAAVAAASAPPARRLPPPSSRASQCT